MFQRAIFGGVGNPLCTIDAAIENGDKILACDDLLRDEMKKREGAMLPLRNGFVGYPQLALFVILTHPYTFLTPPYGVLKETDGLFPRTGT